MGPLCSAVHPGGGQPSSVVGGKIHSRVMTEVSSQSALSQYSAFWWVDHKNPLPTHVCPAVCGIRCVRSAEWGGLFVRLGSISEGIVGQNLTPPKKLTHPQLPPLTSFFGRNMPNRIFSPQLVTYLPHLPLSAGGQWVVL